MWLPCSKWGFIASEFRGGLLFTLEDGAGSRDFRGLLFVWHHPRRRIARPSGPHFVVEEFISW